MPTTYCIANYHISFIITMHSTFKSNIVQEWEADTKSHSRYYVILIHKLRTKRRNVPFKIACFVAWNQMPFVLTTTRIHRNHGIINYHLSSKMKPWILGLLHFILYVKLSTCSNVPHLILLLSNVIINLHINWVHTDHPYSTCKNNVALVTIRKCKSLWHLETIIIYLHEVKNIDEIHSFLLWHFGTAFKLKQPLN